MDKESKKLRNCYFDSQESRQNRVQKKQILNIQEFRPDRSAMQGHCGLRLSLKKILYGTQYSTVLPGNNILVGGVFIINKSFCYCNNS